MSPLQPAPPTTVRPGHDADGDPTPSPGRAHLAGLFVVYLVVLGWAVLWKLEPPSVGGQRAVKLVPFAATGASGASTALEVAANLVLFVPFGLYLGLLAPSRPWWRVVGAVATASLALEVAQYVLGVGRSDLTDVVVNTAGGVAGLGLLALARLGLRGRSVAVLTRVAAVATALALLATGLYLASPVRVVHVRDVGPLARIDAPGGR